MDGICASSGAGPAFAAGFPSPDAIAAVAWTLQPPTPDEVSSVDRNEAAILLDRLLVGVARGRGALDLAIGDALDALDRGDRLMRLGFAGLDDYAREVLGIAGGTALGMARLSRRLRSRPLLREAVLRGEVTASAAEAVLPVALGEAEASWVERARSEPVRSLAAAVRAEVVRTGRAVPEDEGRWERIWLQMTPEGREKLDRAMRLAGKVIGATAPRWQRLEVVCQEYLGGHAGLADEDGSEREVLTGPAAAWLESAKEGLEHETRRWEALRLLNPVPPVAAPGEAQGYEGAAELDARLRELMGMRRGWDELVGHLALLVKMLGLWRDMGFVSLDHYSSERLGMSGSAVKQRAWLERRLYWLPDLRTALREGRVSYEKARLVAGVAEDGTLGEWIGKAERSTCVALRREIEAGAERQMCARGELDLRVPERVGTLLDEAIRAVRAVEGRWMPPGEALEKVADHFIETWEPLLRERRTRRRRVMERDQGFCQVPGCSRRAAHVHHVRHRSQAGGDEDENLISTCVAHHLFGIHHGYIRVTGRAPDALVWEVALLDG